MSDLWNGTGARGANSDPTGGRLRRRFLWTLPFTVLVAALSMIGPSLESWTPIAQDWLAFLLSLPVVLWAGRPMFSRGLQSIRRWNQNMWTLSVWAAALRSCAA